MFGYWSDIERTFAAMDELRRRMEQVLDPAAAGPWPRVSLVDAGSELVLKADVPGLEEKDLQVQLARDVLTVSGERRVHAPQGYSIHRQERTPWRFSRSFSLPCKVEADRISAQIEDGVLTVSMPKTPESQPRRIAVKAG